MQITDTTDHTELQVSDPTHPTELQVTDTTDHTELRVTDPTDPTELQVTDRLIQRDQVLVAGLVGDPRLQLLVAGGAVRAASDGAVGLKSAWGSTGRNSTVSYNTR